MIIIGTHQSTLKMNAGGFVRLREFLKRVPSKLNFFLIDQNPTIYSNLLSKDKLLLFNLPSYVRTLLEKNYLLGVFIERLYSSFKVYEISKKIINQEKINVIYLPIGEFIHLYLPAIFLKLKYPKLKLVVDLLNFENFNFDFVKRIMLIKNKSIISRFLLLIIYFVTYFVLVKTINLIDYIFTVSPFLIKK